MSAAAAIAALLSSPVAHAANLTTYASADSFIYQYIDWFNVNWGSGTSLSVGQNGVNPANLNYRTMQRFDVSALTGNYSSIDSATITFRHTSKAKLAAGQTLTLNLFLLDNTNAAWVEGIDIATTPTTTQGATWNNLSAGDSGSTAWSGGAGIGNSTASVGISTLVDTVAITNDDAVIGGTVTFNLNAAALTQIDSWATGGSNAGFFLTSTEDQDVQNVAIFASREHATDAGPTLSVDYTVIPEPSTAALLIGALAGSLALRRRQHRA